jgi:flagellar biosynthetic protein FliR
MPELLGLVSRHLEGFLLAFFRLGATLAWAPVLGHRSIPVAHRAGLAALLALVLAPTQGAPARPGGLDALGWVVAVAGEVFVGLAVGFVARLVVAAAEVAGELVGFEMGLSIGVVYDPSTGGQEGLVTRLLSTVALLLFLTVNGHHLLIRAVAVSFERLRPGAALEPAMTGGLLSLGGKLLEAGVALAAPVVGVLVVLNVALGLVGRVAPQSNVFLVGLPLSIGLGLFALYETLPGIAQSLGRLIAEMPADLDGLFAGGMHGFR